MTPAPPVKKIWFPVDDPHQPLIVHEVGVMGVTDIVQVAVSPEPYCYQTHFLVYVLDPDKPDKAGRLKFRLDAHGSGAEYV